MANETNPRSRALTSSGAEYGAARDGGMLLALLGGTILIIYGLVQVASGIGLLSANRLDLANIVLVGSALFITSVGVGLRRLASPR